MAIQCDFSGPAEKAYGLIKEYVTGGRLPAQLKAEKAQWNDAAKSVTLIGKGFKATIDAIAQGETGSRVMCDLELNFFLRPFQKTLEPQILSHLQKALKT